MECVICNGRMSYSFSKTFNAFGLATADYWRCGNCGFTMSKTHADMTGEEWSALNRGYHSTYQGKDFNTDDPRWVERLQTQATVLGDAARIGLLDGNGKWVDYACGDGKLADLLKNEGCTLRKYDRYMARHGEYLEDKDLAPRKFDFVITTSVFEHFTLRKQFDAVESLVAENGVLGLHTLVCETVPADPAWFYLLPVHCAFHTNKSMSLLFEQWGYRASVYNVDARLWLWFKQPLSDLPARIERANQRPTGPTYILKNGFVDYWK